jgi:quercetin dioxygenase-like cupin family protein
VHRHKLQEEVFIALKGNGTIILDGKRIEMPEGGIVRVGPKVWRALGNDLKTDVVYMILGHPAEEFSAGRPDAFRRRDTESEKSAALEKS